MRFKVLLTFILLGCVAAAAPPDWFHRREWREYTPEFGLIGVGSANTRESAIDAAIADIARQVEISVSSEVEGLIQSVAENEREIIRSQYSSTVKTATSAKLKGVQIVQTAEDKGTFYALCYLDRKEFASTLSQDISDRLSSLRAVLNSADILLTQGGIFSAIEMLLNNYEKALECDTWQNMLNFLRTEPDRKLTGEASNIGLEFLYKIRTILNNIYLEKVSGDQQKAPLGQLLPHPLEVSAYYKSDDNKYLPISGLTIELFDTQNFRLDRKITDQQGLARFKITASGEGMPTITAAIAPPLNNQLVQNSLHGKKVQFTYAIEKIAPMNFTVKIQDENDKRVVEVEELVNKAITQAGHNVVKDASLCFWGTLKSEEKQTINGYGGFQKVFKVTLNLTLQNAEKNIIFGELIFEAVGTGSSKEQALNKAYNNLSVKADEIAKMLTQSGERLNPYQNK